jgi:hypothetical protein
MHFITIIFELVYFRVQATVCYYNDTKTRNYLV